MQSGRASCKQSGTQRQLNTGVLITFFVSENKRYHETSSTSFTKTNDSSISLNAVSIFRCYEVAWNRIHASHMRAYGARNNCKHPGDVFAVVAADLVLRNINITVRRETENPVRHDSKHSTSATHLFLTRRRWRRSIRDRSVINTRKTNDQSEHLKSHRHQPSNRSNYKEETNGHHSMIETQPTSAACGTRRNCVSVHVCLFHLVRAILTQDARHWCHTNVKTHVSSDLGQTGPDRRRRWRSGFPLVFGRSSTAPRCKWGRIHLVFIRGLVPDLQ